MSLRSAQSTYWVPGYPGLHKQKIKMKNKKEEERGGGGKEGKEKCPPILRLLLEKSPTPHFSEWTVHFSLLYGTCRLQTALILRPPWTNTRLSASSRTISEADLKVGAWPVMWMNYIWREPITKSVSLRLSSEPENGSLHVGGPPWTGMTIHPGERQGRGGPGNPEGEKSQKCNENVRETRASWLNCIV